MGRIFLTPPRIMGDLNENNDVMMENSKEIEDLKLSSSLYWILFVFHIVFIISKSLVYFDLCLEKLVLCFTFDTQKF